MPKKKLLVVDDEEGYRQMYTFLFEPMGVSVETATNGKEAVEKIKKSAFDLVLMDVHMPVMSGPEAIRLIREIRPGQRIMIFSSVSDPSQSQETQALKEGAERCFYKPVELPVLEKILESLGLGPAVT